MKYLLTIVIVFVSTILAEDTVYEPIALYYHESHGIPEAARIKKAEEKGRFDNPRIVGGTPAVLGQFPYQVGKKLLNRQFSFSHLDFSQLMFIHMML